MVRVISLKNIKDSPAVGTAAAFFASLGTGFMLSGTTMVGVASFADISIAGALSLPASAAVLTGSMIHSFISGSVGRDIVKIAAMVIVVILKMFLEPKNDPKICAVTTAAGVFLSGAAVSALIGELGYKLIFYLFYAAVAGFTTYSAATIIMSLRRRFVADLTGFSGCAYAVVYTILIASLCSVNVPVVNIGLIIGAAVTLLAAYFYRHTGGVLCGALTVCGAFLASSEVGMSVVLLPAAGLLTGYMYRQRVTVAAGFFTGLNFMLTVLTGLTPEGIYSMVDIICAAGLFAAAAPYYSDKWVKVTAEDTSALPELLGSRMGFLADSMRSVRTETGKIAELLTSGLEKRTDIADISKRVCTQCFRRATCWNIDQPDTVRGFRKLSGMTEFAKESFPFELSECLHKEELADEFETAAREKATAKLLDIRFSECRSLLYEQIKVMEEMIGAAGERIDVRYSAPVSKMIRGKLMKHGFTPENVIAYYNSENRLLAELYFSYTNTPLSCTRICDLISDHLKLPLSCADPVFSGKEVRIRLFEQPEYSMEVYGASVCAENSKENGDTYTVFSDGTGVSYVVLSDGMGSGKNAAFESRMVVRLFRRLVSSGVGYGAAIKLINSIMVTKSRDENFATLDAVRIDLDSCELTVIKSGASATLIRHRGNVLKVTSATFPIGIYEKSDAFSGEYDLEDGDIVIMFSDGIDENEYLFIKELLLGGGDLKAIVREICSKAEVFNQTIHTDDVTVIGIKVGKSR